MNILSISSFNFSPLKFNESKKSHYSVPRFGLKMAAPLTRDTVSFEGFAQTKKISGDLKRACSAITAKNIIRKHVVVQN